MLNWFSFKSNVTKFEDSFTRSLSGKLLGIKSAIQDAVCDQSHHVVLVAHFVETFTQLQDVLDDQRINYDVVSGKLNQRWFELLNDNSCQVTLTLAQMLEPFPDEADSKKDWSKRFSVMIAEKHPWSPQDDHIRQFCESLPCRVQWGYFMAFEDAVVSKLIDQRAVKILDMFGMGQNELINSKMVSKQLNQALKKIQARYQSTLPADSAAQWFELNMPDG